ARAVLGQDAAAGEVPPGDDLVVLDEVWPLRALRLLGVIRVSDPLDLDPAQRAHPLDPTHGGEAALDDRAGRVRVGDGGDEAGDERPAQGAHGALAATHVLNLATNSSWGTDTGLRPRPGLHPHRTSRSRLTS